MGKETKKVDIVGQNVYEQIGSRLKTAYDYLHYIGKVETQEDFATSSKVSRSLMAAAINGKEAGLRGRILERITIAFPQISYAWLKTGEGEMLAPSSSHKVDYEEELSLPSILASPGASFSLPKASDVTRAFSEALKSPELMEQVGLNNLTTVLSSSVSSVESELRTIRAISAQLESQLDSLRSLSSLLTTFLNLNQPSPDPNSPNNPPNNPSNPSNNSPKTPSTTNQNN